MSKKHILIVEDDLDTQKLTGFMLKSVFELSFADSYSEAVDALKNTEVDLILMDLSIRGEKDGLQLTTEIRKKGKYRNIPIIAVTAHALATDRQNAIQSGCDDYLAKPFKKMEILEKIRKNLPE